VIPKLYNGRNKTFWFFSFDQFYIRGGQLSGLNTNATGKMLAGDFSELTVPIADPRSTAINSSGVATRSAFPGNLIPKTAFSNVTSKMLPFYPPAELPGLTGNSIAPLGSPRADQRTSGFKIDQTIHSNHRLSGMFNYTDRPSQKSPAPSRLLPVGNTTAVANYNFQVVTTRLIRVNYDWTISPTMVNHIGSGFSRFRNPNFSLSYNDGWVQPDGGKLGLRGLQYDLFPTVMFSQNYTRLGDDIASDNYFTTLALLDNLTWIRSRHTLKMGFEVQVHRDNFRNFGNGGGTFNFNQLETAMPGVANSGSPIASWLLGAVDTGTAYFRDSLPGGRYKYYGWFLDDTYKLTTKFTLNLGLRYEIQSPSADPLGRLSYMDPSVPNPGAGGRLGAYVFGGTGQGRQGWTQLFDTHYKNFAPRVGIAYNFMKGTVLRGGYGIFYKEYIDQGVGRPQTGFSITPSFVSADAGITPAFYWDAGFPQNFSHPPQLTPTVANGQTAAIVQKATGGTIPYSQQWNMTLERQFGDKLLVSAAYVGNKVTHMYDSLSVNQVNPSFYGLGATTLGALINSPAAQAAGIGEPFPGFVALYGSRATVAQALRPFPQYQAITTAAAPYANSTYNSFQLKVDKRLSHGLTGTLAYTRSKMLSDGVGFSTSNNAVIRQDLLKREKFLYPTDQPTILTVSFNYAIPFRHRLAGGWSVAAVGAYSTGYAIPVYYGTNVNSFVFNGGQRPNLTGAPLLEENASFDPNAQFFLNRAAFAAPPSLTFGNAPAYLPARQPNFKSESFGVFKDTRFTERVNLQFRMEVSNPFNRVVFGAPVSDLSAGNFGRITSVANSPRNIQFGLKTFF